jgi:hypothetical protein
MAIAEVHRLGSKETDSAAATELPPWAMKLRRVVIRRFYAKVFSGLFNSNFEG